MRIDHFHPANIPKSPDLTLSPHIPEITIRSPIEPDRGSLQAPHLHFQKIRQARLTKLLCLNKKKIYL
jgi:hypothetical protein